ncbi:site-specific integrase [Okeania sp. SIO2B3]|uniref:tyrosine-type recombinase/integrase n=1 Tax=Okeania sp. SIO2B3 TaxID=2607784 RepID=UPI0013BF6361|nr:site-specific integrase [Okeania sp. SIO2B3]NET44650.1 site-specific integrase [Okeania sp. SIO2B3]
MFNSKDTPKKLNIKHPSISFHPTLKERLEVNWEEEYSNEFICPQCNQGILNKFSYKDSALCKLRLKCNQCHKLINLTCNKTPKRPRISIHSTLQGKLEVNWENEYHNEFTCPQCNQGTLNKFQYCKNAACKLRLACNTCDKVTFLSCQLRKHPVVSIHQTLFDKLQVDWKEEYNNEFTCFKCNQGKLDRFVDFKGLHNVKLGCNFCGHKTTLSCQVSPHIHGYRSDLICPNPLCTQIGHNGQKGWIYETFNQENSNCSSNCRCYFCGINFDPTSQSNSSWIGNQNKDELLPFCFEDDIWNFRHFIDNPQAKTLNFRSIKVQWYREQVKGYLHFLLKTGNYTSVTVPVNSLLTLRQFGRILYQHKIQQANQISRQLILVFLDNYRANCNRTIREKLYILKNFFDWLGLNAVNLVRLRDIPKVNYDNPDWLDEITRKAIKQHLSKIPLPIANQYLIQEYTAARPNDICQMSLDCLVEENGKWYIRFYQNKTSRWHQIFATREIRQIIEKQQQWVRQNLGSDYAYLFCHFRSIRQESYPAFENIKPLPKPPTTSAGENPMVRIIRMLIENEDIRDANGQQPHFTGKITRHSRLQEVRTKYGIEAAQLYADHQSSNTTFQHYAPPTKEQIAEVDLPFQKLLMNPDNKFLPWQSLPESLLQNPKAHELDLEIAPRLVVYGHCALDSKTPCPVNLYPKCYGCSSFRPSTGKLPLYERQYQGEQQRLIDAEKAGAELAYEEAKATIEAMDKWLPELRRLADGEEKA